MTTATTRTRTTIVVGGCMSASTYTYTLSLYPKQQTANAPTHTHTHARKRDSQIESFVVRCTHPFILPKGQLALVWFIVCNTDACALYNNTSWHPHTQQLNLIYRLSNIRIVFNRHHVQNEWNEVVVILFILLYAYAARNIICGTMHVCEPAIDDWIKWKLNTINFSKSQCLLLLCIAMSKHARCIVLYDDWMISSNLSQPHDFYLFYSPFFWLDVLSGSIV